MSPTERKVVVLPCSGIGKVYGALAREIAYEVVERECPGKAVLTCLPLLVVEDPEALELIRKNPVVTIDGCPKDCAMKTVKAHGGAVAQALQAIDFYKAHKDLRPGGIAELDPPGKELARVAAREMKEGIERLSEGKDGAK